MKSLNNMINNFIQKYELKHYNTINNDNNNIKNKKLIISQIIFLYSKVFPDTLDPDESYIYWLDNNIFGTIFTVPTENVSGKDLGKLYYKDQKKLSNIIDKKLKKNTNSGKNKTQLLENIKLFLLE